MGPYTLTLVSRVSSPSPMVGLTLKLVGDLMDMPCNSLIHI